MFNAVLVEDCQEVPNLDCCANVSIPGNHNESLHGDVARHCLALLQAASVQSAFEGLHRWHPCNPYTLSDIMSEMTLGHVRRPSSAQVPCVHQFLSMLPLSRCPIQADSGAAEGAACGNLQIPGIPASCAAGDCDTAFSMPTEQQLSYRLSRPYGYIESQLRGRPTWRIIACLGGVADRYCITLPHLGNNDAECHTSTHLEIGPDASLCCGGLHGFVIVKCCWVLENVFKEGLVMGFESQVGLLWPVDDIQCFRPQIIREPACSDKAWSLIAQFLRCTAPCGIILTSAWLTPGA